MQAYTIPKTKWVAELSFSEGRLTVLAVFMAGPLANADNYEEIKPAKLVRIGITHTTRLQ